MSGTDGISSLQKALGTLNISETKQSKPATELGSSVATGRSVEVPGSKPRTHDQASVSVAGGLAAQGTSDGDVRLDKVAALQQQIAAGTYKVSAGDVADKIVSSLLSGS